MNEFWGRLWNRITYFFIWALEEHPGKLAGTLAGFVLGLFIVLLGFWKSVVVCLFVAAGFLLGKRHDERKALFSWVERFWYK